MQEVERVLLHTLVPGQPLGGPLYDAVGNLLLAKGKMLTRELWRSLQRARANHAYIGDWNAADRDDSEPVVPLSDRVQVAEQMTETLEAEMETRLTADFNPTVEVGKNAFERKVDQDFQPTRTNARIQEWQSTIDDGVSDLDRIMNGAIQEDEVAAVTSKIVGKVMEAFAKDRSLLNHLIAREGPGAYLHRHALNSAVLSVNITSALQFDEKQMMDVGVGALMANVGMGMLPEELLSAERELSEAERVDIQKHIGLGLYALKQFRGLPLTTPMVVYQHKERADGTGYPKRRKRRVIHEYAQIVSVSDVYDAMTNDRPWRKAHHPYRVMEHLIRDANKKFSPKAVRGLLKYLSLFPIGSLVRLNTGEIARVVHANRDHFDKPIVSVIFDANGHPLRRPISKNMLEHEDLRVESVIEDEIDVPHDLGF